MKRWLTLLMACLALGLVAAGCGDDDEDEGGGGGATATTEEQPADTGGGGEEAGGGASVTMKDIKFRPHDLTVTAGTTVTWTNEDSVPHTVTKETGPGEKFDSGTVEPGATFEQTLSEPGKVSYVCTIHPGQDGTVTVE
jgi:plastocyanin